MPSAKSSLAPLGAPSSRTEQVVEALAAAILDGALRPGDRLVERELAARLGVSKTPVREALKILEQKGLASANTFRGAEVVAVDDELAHSVYEVRELLEPAAVRLAVPLHDLSTVHLVGAALDAAEAAAGGRIAELSRANRRFHQLLYAPCPNVLLRSLLDGLQDRVALITVTGWRQSSTWGNESEEHRSILAAVAAGDAERAEAELREHIRRFAVRLRESQA
jgi:DNA-binding GntR family transcriptional regulator